MVPESISCVSGLISPVQKPRSCLINGDLTTIVIAMVPPLWHSLMTHRVIAWDRDG